VPEVAGHLGSDVGRGAIGVHMHELHARKVVLALHEGVDERMRGGGAAVDVDAVTRTDLGDRTFEGDELHVGPPASLPLRFAERA